MTIEFEIEDKEAKKILDYLRFKKLTGNFVPDVDPIDRLMLYIAKEIESKKDIANKKISP